MKIRIIYTFLLVLLCQFPACGKKNNKKLAQNYYKLGMTELSTKIETPGQEILAYKQALSYIDKALEQETTAEYLACKATLLFKLKNSEQAKILFTQALQEKMPLPLKNEILNNYACLLAQNNQEEEALRIWQKLVNDEYYVTPEVAYVNQGKVYEAKQKYHEAKECYSKALALAPDYLDAHYYLTTIAQKQGDTSLAEQTITQAYSLDPSNKGILMLAQQLGVSTNNA